MYNYDDFRSPSAEYTLVPFWFWNSRIEKPEITRQLELMKQQHVHQCVIHSRHGLVTPYLSEEWFDCITHTINEGKRLGIKFWIYDEHNWPSGYAGGRVLEVNPDFCAKHLCRIDLKAGERLNPSGLLYIVAAFIKSNGRWERIPDAQAAVDRTVFAVRYTRWKVAYGEDYYVDVLNPKATEVFLQVTHEEYLRRYGDEMGKTILGFFSDEAGFFNGLQLPWSDRTDDGTVIWSDGLPEYFKNRNGYDICDYLPYLFEMDEEKSPQVRRHFYDTVADIYIESFLRPQRMFCEQHGMKLIGHLHYEDYLHMQIATQGDFSKALSELSYAGCDRIEYTPGSISERLTASVARQYRKQRTLSESFAQGGWDFTMQDVRRWTDYQLVRGINLFVVHAFYYSIDGFRRNDAPPSYFFQSPAYSFFHIYSDYTMRLCQLLSSGTPVNTLALYYPTATGQVLFDPLNHESVRALDRDFQAVVSALEEAQYDCCLLNDDAIAGAEYSNGFFIAGIERFSAMAILAKWIPFKTFDSIYKMAKQGLPVVFLLYRPRCIETAFSEKFNEMLEELMGLEWVELIDGYHFYRKFTYQFDVRCFQQVPSFIENARPVVELKIPDSSIKCCARNIGDITAYFIVNEGPGKASNIIYFRENRHPVIWDALDGSRKGCNYWTENGCAAIKAEIAPYSSMLVVFGDEKALPPSERHLLKRYVLDGLWDVRIGGKYFKSAIRPFSVDEFGEIETITYEYSISVDCPGNYAELCFGGIRNICSVSVNGKDAGTILWNPYRVGDVPLSKGENRISVTVYSTPAGVILEKALPFGIEGPVYLDIYKRLEESHDSV